MNGCSLGCVTHDTCNICLNSLCSVCLDFGNTCIQCVQNAINISGQCQCISSNYIAIGSTCVPCFSGCSTCLDKYINSCLTCTNPLFVICEGVCLANCPDGYVLNRKQCIPNGYSVISLRLYGETQYGTIGNVSIGNNNLTKDSCDPIPTPGRGYYFSLSSQMTIPSKLLFSIMTINM